MNASLMSLFIFGGLGLILLELIVGVQTGFDLVLLGSTMVVGGLVGGFFQNDSVGIITTIVLSIVYIFIGRKIIKEKLNTKSYKTNVDDLVGKTGTVVKIIKSGKAGQVKIGSEVWRAEAEGEIEVDTKVKVLDVEGVSLKVVRL
ncbi:hypothetical protein A2773_05335 [Candidatus Gottesmanbacteria bacterium RIFCSPHIGHO2_01_FULL_39_10]|uniref:NfeD-like C-terminal domain-containing protein n=1 Tax=Candidatus Gottesmanbacteria bacterium RIFCSPHIGHO2_01_FULL_39_10 TaxID=1798375 RepID=A0A1F5ZP88_9BACT|nr:MAG: hypothetical protein A2773_05335 [Candidatus Gottesmanbacteria bacterium RIFCSPHIGHO2_01_FULL_39_10]